jgi:hypothetical protein
MMLQPHIIASPTVGGKAVRFGPMGSISAQMRDFIRDSAKGGLSSTTIGPGELIPTSSESMLPAFPFYHDQERTRLPPASWKCLSGSHVWIVGLCFDEIGSRQAEEDTPGYQVSTFGIQRRAWLAGRDWTSSRSGSSMKFRLTLEYHVADGTNWIAVRFKGSSLENIEVADLVGGKHTVPALSCLDGCDQQDTLIVEPQTGWRIFTVRPDKRVIHLEATAVMAFDVVDTDRAAPVLVPSRNEVFELIELDPANVGSAPELDLSDLGRGLRNPLLGYAANAQKALAPDGWLAPTSDRPDLDVAFSLARQQRWQSAVDQPFDVPDSPALAASSAWRERQMFALTQMGPLNSRLLDLYMPRLSTALETLSQVGSVLQLTKSQLDDAVAALERLSEQRAWALLRSTSKVLNVELSQQADPALDAELLAAAVFGAHASVDRLMETIGERRSIACRTLRDLAFQSRRTGETAIQQKLTAYCSE